MELKNYLSKNWKKLLLWGSLTVFVLLFVTFASATYIIINEIETVCFKTQKIFPGDAVKSLTAALKSENITIKEKNQIIWVLGEIGDRQAVPALQALETGETCDKPCDPDKKICQYGIQKAIHHCEGINIIRPVWQIIHPA